MRSFLITLAAASTALMLSGCPDIPSGPTHDARSDSSRKASHPAGAIDEALSHRSCPDSHPRRTLFRF
jgi:hypothetical protein